jgi:2'-5' RNA ligase
MRLLRELLEASLTPEDSVFVGSYVDERFRSEALSLWRNLPALESDGERAHVTLYYAKDSLMGVDVEAYTKAFREAIQSLRPALLLEPRDLLVHSISWFDAPAGKPNPIILTVSSAYLHALHMALVHAFNPLNVSKQYLRYRPHLTLGYLPSGALNDDVKGKIRNLPPLNRTIPIRNVSLVVNHVSIDQASREDLV